MKVSIVTVSYNSAEFIRTAIESVMSQSYSHIEYIIIDGSSTDGTVEIIKEYAENIKHIVSEADEGIYDAMNKGIALASGDIIGILNSDDFYPNTEIISDVVEEWSKQTNADLALGNIDFVKASSLNKVERKYSAFNFSEWQLRFGFMPPHPAAFIKKTAYDKIGNYKLGYRIGADFDMFVRMLLVNKLPYFKINKTLVRMRIGGVSTSGIESYITSTKEILQSLRENGSYTNIAMVLIRLPIKFIQKLFVGLTFR